MKGDYDFYILVTCLLILALQIHNPFQRNGIVDCRQCNGVGEPVSTAAATGRSGAAVQSDGRAGGRMAPQQSQQAPPVSRRAEAAPTGATSTADLLRELDSIQAKAKDQQDTLTQAGRMPPPSPMLEQLKASEAREASMGGGAAMAPQVPQQAAYARPAATPWGAQAPPPVGGGGAAMPPAMGAGMGAMGGDAPLVRRREDLGRFLESRQPRGLGVVVGVGRGDFALRLLQDWGSSQGVYLVDPYIHIFRGYDDPANLPDRDHQLVFEDLRNRLQQHEGRYVLVRDFSHSFAEQYNQGGQTPGPPTFVYVDANHGEEAVARDLELWWQLLAPGGVLAGSTYADDNEGRIRVRTVVDRFAMQQRAKVYLTHDDMPPSWFMFKG